MNIAPQRLDPLETVRQAYVLLRAASEHFEQLLRALPLESQDQLLDRLQKEGVGSFLQRLCSTGQTRKNEKRRPLKHILLDIVSQHPEGLSLQELLDKVEEQYQSKSADARHVVRTTIAKLLKAQKAPWQFTEGLHKPWPF